MRLAIAPETTLDSICICAHQARKHHPSTQAWAYTCSICSCMYFETAPISEARPVEAQLADAIRCTTHIDDRLLRARYVLKDMELRGFIVQKVARDATGRF